MLLALLMIECMAPWPSLRVNEEWPKGDLKFMDMRGASSANHAFRNSLLLPSNRGSSVAAWGKVPDSRWLFQLPSDWFFY